MLISGFVILVASFLVGAMEAIDTTEAETLDKFVAMSWAQLIFDGMHVPAAILAIFIVRGIDTRQTEKRRHSITVGQGA